MTPARGPRRGGLSWPPTLATERLRLRALTPADAPALFALLGDPEVCRYWGGPPLRDLEAAAALERELARRVAARVLLQWGIAERTSEGVVGICALAALAPEHRRAEVGFALNRSAWGRGYIGEALPALVGFAFATLGLNRLEAEAEPHNARSIRALERAGFRREGVLRERYIVDGAPQDAVMYGLLQGDWVGARIGL